MTEVVRYASLISALEVIADQAPEQGLTLEQLLERLGDRAFGAAMFVLALPCCIPFLPVVPQIVSIPMLVLASQMAAGRTEPWLPKKLGAQTISKASLGQMARGARKWFGGLERLARPRLQGLTEGAGERVCGAAFFVFALAIMIPFPFSNGPPAFGMVAASLGLIMSDGLLVLIGLTLGMVWVLVLLIGGPALVYALIAFATGLFGG